MRKLKYMEITEAFFFHLKMCTFKCGYVRVEYRGLYVHPQPKNIFLFLKPKTMKKIIALYIKEHSKYVIGS